MKVGSARETAASDDAVLERLRAGDEATFADLVDRLTPAMRHVARAYVRDDAAAEDIVQDAWLGLLRGLATFEGRSSLRGWIFAIVVNRAKTRGVRDARAVPFSSLAREESERDDPAVDPGRFAGPDVEWPRHWAAEPASWGDRPEERLLGREMRARLDAAIAALPPVQRTVVLLRDVAGESSASVGAQLELTEANVRVLLHRGRAKIRQSIERYVTLEEATV